LWTDDLTTRHHVMARKNFTMRKRLLLAAPLARS